MGGVASIAGYLAALAALIASGVTAFGAPARPLSASRGYLVIALCAVALAVTLAAPITLAATASIEPIPNITRLLGDALAVFAAFCVLAMLAHTVGSPAAVHIRICVQAAVAGAVVAVMTGLLMAAHTRSTIEFANTYAVNPSAVVYEILYVGYMCWGMVSFIWLIRRYATRRTDGMTRAALRVTMVAAALGLVWAVWKIANIVVIIATGHPVGDQASISELLAAAVIGTIALGVALPSWARWALARAERYQARRAYRALTPLWTTLTTEVPHIALRGVGIDGGIEYGGIEYGGIEYALYRRVIEIRDAQLALRPYIPPTLPNQVAEAVRAAGLEQDQANRVIEATELAAAIAAHHAGHRYRSETIGIGIPRQQTPMDVRAEARWLASLTRTMRRDALVAQLVDRTSADLPDQPLQTDRG